MTRHLAALAFLMTGTALAPCAYAQAPQPKAVVETYANVAQAMYEDAPATARDLQKAVDAFLASPTDETLKAARDAWLKARVPYQQTEGYRFGNARRRLGGQGECLAARRGPDRLCRRRATARPRTRTRSTART